MYNMDMSAPGAFALVCRCGASKVVTPPPSRRPARVVATRCEYASISNLRADIGNRADKELTQKVRRSYGLAAERRSE